MWRYNYPTENELYHFGVLGMKWGVRRQKANYKSAGIASAIARKKNEKVDAGFKNWKENSEKKSNAIDLGKKANLARMAYEKDRSNDQLKTEYKQTSKSYKKALKSNTTYRKGDIKKEVGQDAARKYLSEAKKLKKQLDADPSNPKLKSAYNSMMSKHDVERANARRAPEVAAKRSRKKASIKRAMTISAKVAATSAVVGVGVHVANKYLSSRNVTVNGKRVVVNGNTVNGMEKAVKFGKDLLGYL